MSAHTLRFGVIATVRPAAQWAATARHVAELGYSTVLVPDGLEQLSPIPALAYAAASADLTVGTFVLAAPLRPPRSTAWEAHAMTELTGGRFELGLGTGLPGAAAAATDEFGLPALRPGQRLDAVRKVIDHVRVLDGDTRTPVLLAAGGPRSRALAAQRADIVTLAVAPTTPRAEHRRLIDDVRDRAGARADDLEFALNVAVIGDRMPDRLRGYLGDDVAPLAAADALMLLRGSTREMADEVQRRRDELGITYVCVNAEFREQFAPVVDLLAGR